jgi:hypothetical protein
MPSRRLRSAAQAERDRIARELGRLNGRRDQLLQELGAIDRVRGELADQLRVLNQFVHDADAAPASTAPQLHLAPEPGATDEVVLRGARIREVAVRILAGTPEARRPVHYRTWFELVRAQGFVPAGKDPHATFLTQIGRSPVVRRTNESGTYQLDFDFPNKARQQLGELRTELQQEGDLPSDVGIKAITLSRRRRAALTSKMEAVERALEEAERSLGPE